MSKTKVVLLRIAGSVVGFLAGGLAGGALLVALLYHGDGDGSKYGRVRFYVYGALGFLIGGTIGAAASATGMQKVLRQRLGREEEAVLRKALIGLLMLGLLGLLAIGIPLTGFGIWVMVACPDLDALERLVYGFYTTAIGLALSLLAGWRLWRAVGEFRTELGPGFSRRGNDTHCKKCGTELVGAGGPCPKCSPYGAIFGLVIGAVKRATVGSGWKAEANEAATSRAESGSSFVRQGNETHCKKCGSELIGPGGPCRKCDDVKTNPCSSCGRYILPNDKPCPYCGAESK